MEKISDFIKYLLERVEKHDCYMWGGQGESVLSKTPKQIMKQETTDVNAGRVIAHIGALLNCGYDLTDTKFFDCSGLGTYYFVEHGLIKSDTTADGLYNKCSKINIKSVQAGDMVFKISAKTDSKGNRKTYASHVGYMIDNKNCVEMIGRDKGIVCRKLGAGSNFTHAGRPKFNWK